MEFCIQCPLYHLVNSIRMGLGGVFRPILVLSDGIASQVSRYPLWWSMQGEDLSGQCQSAGALPWLHRSSG